LPDKNLIVIAGPTAAGKTALAIKIALLLKTEIISADSRQFYKEMEIGTAKPTEDELNKIKHHFINSLSIHDEYNAGKYEHDALKFLEELFKIHNTVVLTGGSGLFIRAVCEGLDTLPPADEGLRTHYEKILRENGIEPIQAELKEKDPHYYLEVDTQNPRRLIRALEVIKLTGKPYSDLRRQKPAARKFGTVKIGLAPPKDILKQRINRRMDEMIDKGWLNECEKLYPFRELNALKTIGYSELFDFIEGKTDLETAISQIKINTWHYARRQLTWLKRDRGFRWFTNSEEDEIVEYINQK
jgi:tRNA dimethylallyltransferase